MKWKNIENSEPDLGEVVLISYIDLMGNYRDTTTAYLGLDNNTKRKVFYSFISKNVDGSRKEIEYSICFWAKTPTCKTVKNIARESAIIANCNKDMQKKLEQRDELYKREQKEGEIKDFKINLYVEEISNLQNKIKKLEDKKIL